VTPIPRLSDSQIHDALSPYGGSPTSAQCDSIRTYIDLLLQWNRRVSLTTVIDPDDILRFHIGESIAAIPAVPIEKGRLADVGSGAGLPGIPLALFVPGLDVTLIESNTKKATFLSEVTRKLSLDRVRVFRGRAEDLVSDGAKLDYVTARAVGRYDELLFWSSEALNPHGKAILWLGEKDADDISGFVGWNWCPPQRIAGSLKRFLLVGTRSRNPRTTFHVEHL
jgi:16S rRNA (guanine527-N7)-methyltransferase